jgi:hypothetical protein
MVFNHFPMRSSRSLVVADPRLFVRARAWRLAEAEDEPRALGDDLRLFASTFAAGFLFVSILVA